MQKLSCFLLLIAGMSIQTAAAVPTGIPKTDANANADYYILTDSDETASIEYEAGKAYHSISLNKPAAASDASANADYYILTDSDETASIEYEAGKAYHSISLNKPAAALYYGARVGREVY